MVIITGIAICGYQVTMVIDGDGWLCMVIRLRVIIDW